MDTNLTRWQGGQDAGARFKLQSRRLGVSSRCLLRRSYRKRVFSRPLVLQDGWQGWIYTPAVTVGVFLSECLSPDHSCRDAVARLIARRVARGLRACSAETSAYCTARVSLPEAACHRLVCQKGSDLECGAPAEWRWHKRRVRMVDGSTTMMPETAADQAEYPQTAS
jgi:hypothetical protein